MVQRVKDCVPEHLLDRIVESLSGANWKYGWRSNNSPEIFSHWNFEIASGAPENGLDIADQLTGAMLETWRYLQHTYFPDTVLMRCYANSHTYGVEGYPHWDSTRPQDRTLVVYLNKIWKREWAGETVIFDGDDIVHAELPKYNQGVVFDSNLVHVARGVTRICPEQRITLMFKFAPKDSDPMRDDLQRFLTDLGARDIVHTKQSFLSHLLNTYDLLRQAGASDTVCQAGAAHSIFGTNMFQHQTLTRDQRSVLVDAIGEDSTRLVELFASIDRPRALETALDTGSMILDLHLGGTTEVDIATLNDLCWIECANLKEQHALKNWPNLQDRWKILLGRNDED